MKFVNMCIFYKGNDMKKLLAVGLLFINFNCFGMSNLDGLKMLCLQVAECEVPSRLCVKALDLQKNEIAEYIGLNYIGTSWTLCREACQQHDQLVKPDIVKLLEVESHLIVRSVIIQQAAKDKRYDVIDFISENV